jgi:hypothetical protein
MLPNRRIFGGFVALIALAVLSMLDVPPALSQTATQFQGGFLEKSGSAIRPRWTNSQVQSIVPADRLKFTFPAPYNTEAVRMTTAADCANRDCVRYVGYSYWRNSNNHVASTKMLMFVTLMRSLGGTGPTLFSYDKTTDQITKVGPLFDTNSRHSWESGEGWYFSGTMPTKLYMTDGSKLRRYDVMAKEFQDVFDVSYAFGANRQIWQAHSSNNDQVHSATLQAVDTGEYLGCVVFFESTKQYRFYPKIGIFDECNLDKSGRWTVSLEDIGVPADIANRIFDNSTGEETRLSGPYNTPGHMDLGYGYFFGGDGYNPLPNAQVLWDLEPTIQLGPVVYQSYDWYLSPVNHLSHGNAKPSIPAADQYACGSNADRYTYAQNEVVCFRLDGSLNQLVVAPVMTDLNASGGQDDYGKLPKGNVDITGKYFIWTSNIGSNRLDAFVVKIPAEVMYGQAPIPPANPTTLPTSKGRNPRR